MNTFKVKAFKQTGKVFSCWIESPNGIVTRIDLDKKEYMFSNNNTYLLQALQYAIDSYIRDLETYFHVAAGITADALGSIHSNSFLATDFTIPAKKS